MKKFLAWASVLLTSILISFSYRSGSAQTLSLNDATITQKQTQRIGMNIGAIDYYESQY